MDLNGDPQVSLQSTVETTTFSSGITDIMISDTQSIGTVIIVVIAFMAALTVLFFIGVFIDCRQQKIQNERVKKSKQVLQNVIPKILKSDDRAGIVQNEHHTQQTDLPYATV